MKCQGKTSKGNKCKNLVSGKSKYCHHHKRKYSIGRKITKQTCKNKLSDKIKVNMEEYKKGRWQSRKQAVAVSYNQVKKKNPGCKKYF